MLNRTKHQLIMGQILKDIYTDISIASLLGLKGGTCAYFFYGLPRFSVDLDFDLLPGKGIEKQTLLEKIENILKKYGNIRDKYVKRYTIFIVLSYGDEDHNVKVEISTRKGYFSIRENYELKKYLGISMLAAKMDYLFANKLAALTLRKKTAMRDIYDIRYFAKNNWDINEDVLKAYTGKTTKKHLADCIAVIKKIKDNQILQGLGELISEKEKAWVKSHLKEDVLFLMRLRLEVK
ncbi:MAG: nucleotidyl transferase AbiEii/AbiGii toxin family protein [bacterium]